MNGDGSITTHFSALWQRLRRFLVSATARLAATYLAIMLIMSLCFTVAIYNVSSHELGRKAPPNAYFRGNGSLDDNPGNASGDNSGPSNVDDSTRQSIDEYLQTRASEARHALIQRLVLLNLLVLLGGGALSYYLARRTLQPIEEAMEAQVQFVSDASHELRTPLTAIQTSNEVALRRTNLTLPEARKLIEQNTGDVKRLKTLSDGLLNLAQHRQTDVILAPVKLQTAASDAMTLVVPQANAKDITVEDNVANLQVLGDRSSLVQALVILLDNAVKYSHKSGTVHLETRTKGKTVWIDIRDAGIGIRASDMPHLFRRFYRADNARTSGAGSAGQHSGYGLGLAIAKQIVHAMHGEIAASSTLGKGSTFSIKLPAA